MKHGTNKFYTEIFRGRPDTLSLIADFEHRIKYTYLSRLNMAKRLQTRNATWNTFLISSSLITTIISVVLLVDTTVYGPQGAALVVLAGLATFAASLSVTSANYAARTEILNRTYRELQRLWAAVSQTSKITHKDYLDLENRYQRILDESPNHSEADYAKVLRDINRKNRSKNPDQIRKITPGMKFSEFISATLTFLPIGLSIMFSLLLIPAIKWLFQ